MRSEPNFKSSHFTCEPNITGFEETNVKKQIISMIDWSPFIYNTTRNTPYCHDFCKIDLKCEFFMNCDGFCMMGKFPEHAQIDLSTKNTLISILRTNSKYQGWGTIQILVRYLCMNQHTHFDIL